jgi:hypothetical protein
MSGGSSDEQGEDMTNHSPQEPSMLASLNPFLAAAVTYRQGRIMADFAGTRARRARHEAARSERRSARVTSSLRRHFPALPR